MWNQTNRLMIFSKFWRNKMQRTDLQHANTTKFLISSLIISAFILVIANLFNQENYAFLEYWYPTDILFIIIPGIVVVLSIRLAIMHGGTGAHGKAWMFFSAFIIFWFAAEQLFDYYVDYDLNDWKTYIADVLWISGYPLFFGFALFYLKIVKKAISRKIIITSCLISTSLLIPSLYFSLEDSSDLELIEVAIALAYPIWDTIILCPTVIGIIIFLKGKVNFLWTLILFAIVCNVAGDTFYTITLYDDSYYPGHPLDILFIWAYVFFAFGVYSHIRLFSSKDKKQTIGNNEH